MSNPEEALQTLAMYPGQLITRMPDRERMRFEAAVAAMQGILASDNWCHGGGAAVVRNAVLVADALLAELAKEKL